MADGIPGWEDLHHSGLLLDGTRLAALDAEWPLPPLSEYVERELRRRGAALLGEVAGDAGGSATGFVSFLLEQVCGFDAATGTWTLSQWRPQFLMAQSDFADAVSPDLKIGYRRVARTTDARTFIGAVCPLPCGDSVFVLLVGKGDVQDVASASSLVNSLVFDYAIRTRLGGVNLSWYAIEECSLAHKDLCGELWHAASRLNFAAANFAPSLIASPWAPSALLPAERARPRVVIDCTVASLYGLSSTTCATS